MPKQKFVCLRKQFSNELLSQIKAINQRHEENDDITHLLDHENDVITASSDHRSNDDTVPPLTSPIHGSNLTSPVHENYVTFPVHRNNASSPVHENNVPSSAHRNKVSLLVHENDDSLSVHGNDLLSVYRNSIVISDLFANL
ncbi:5457_t:CDS:2 [Cetraspora pellucida]|uniref:5457_t:CDS:1 n=1 Tax=Cetraspora pellucida TaxID=1433469 RepID=A0ACA9MA52_9GLOM|nr:5457_t:CDS:2 [Cetraspora pellucida]